MADTTVSATAAQLVTGEPFKVTRRKRDQFSPSWGATCHYCGAWLTKWDFTPEDAAASAAQALETHSCSLPRERAV